MRESDRETEGEWTLASQVAFFEGFWNATPMNMFAVYPLQADDFAIEAINPAMEAALGQSASEVAHRPLAEVLPEAYLESIRERYRQCLVSAEPLTYEEEGSLDPAQPRWWSTLLVPVSREGEVVRIFGVSSEITELYEAYAELTRLNSQLEKRVAERTRELEAAKARLEQLARVDELTGTWNRRYLFEIAPALLDRCRRQGKPVGGIMMDADHFKLLNDRQGHQAGDEALRRIAAVVRSQLRASDTVGRYGGEEFLALLPGADQATAEAVGERIRQEVATQGAEVGTTDRPALSLSLGVTTVDPAVDSLETLIHRADKALLRAKDSGRNRVEAG